MTEWSRSEPIYDLIPNLYVQKVFKNEDFQYYLIYPCEGYMLHIPSGDSVAYDEEDNIVLDENGKTVVEPYLTMGGATTSANYDFESNVDGFKAVKSKEINY